MRKLLKFITCGSVDDGKSTLIGHLLYDAKLLYTDQQQSLELDSRLGSREGAIDYSLLLDGLMAEREQGITIDVAYRYFTTDLRSFIVADTPGHEEYTRNMAVGASYADLAVILIDASQGVLVQTRRHARICAMMGIKYFVFAVNKMDLVGYKKEIFEEIEADVLKLKDSLDLENIYMIPLSATEGDNVTHKSKNIPWYAGEPLISYLENVDITSNTAAEAFYLPVQRVCRPNHTFRGFQGQVEEGRIQVGDEITVLPNKEKALVKQIYVTDRNVNAAFSGQPVTIQLDREVDVSRGCVLTTEPNLPILKSFMASVLWMDDQPLLPGKDYLIKAGAKMLPCVVAAIKYKTDVNTGEQLPASQITKNEISSCEIVLSEKAVLDVFSSHKTLGELILIDRVTNATAACGIIASLNGQEAEDKTCFRYRDISAQSDIFEEFYYNLESSTIIGHNPDRKTYTVGDTVPIKGESYRYPDSFDIIILKDRTAVLVRDREITDILPIETYTYTGIPLSNERGFGIRVKSREEFTNFLSEYQNALNEGGAAFFNKWNSFDSYRQVIFNSDFWMI
ncbi:MAG: sulfate adenylyltransferase subunit 1 [Lachnospiraceae bacterium]